MYPVSCSTLIITSRYSLKCLINIDGVKMCYPNNCNLWPKTH